MITHPSIGSEIVIQELGFFYHGFELSAEAPQETDYNNLTYQMKENSGHRKQSYTRCYVQHDFVNVIFRRHPRPRTDRPAYCAAKAPPQ